MKTSYSKPPNLIQNCVYIPEKDLYLKSCHVHDYVSTTLDDGTAVFNDGGLSYIRRSIHNNGRVVGWDLYDNSPFEAIAEGLIWGTFGKEGNKPMRHRPLSTLELDHLIAIRDTQTHISPLYRKVVNHWIAVKTAAIQSA